MAFKEVNIDGIGVVKLYKRKNSRSVKLKVSSEGIPTVSLPRWTPYYVGIDFIKQHSNWLQTQTRTKSFVRSGSQMFDGKQILFLPSDNKKYRNKNNDGTLFIYMPEDTEETDSLTQKYALKTCEKLLQNRAEKHLRARLSYLSNALNISYKKASIKKLRSRWGSCSNTGEITLSSFLCQLPEILIDYVVVHELVHTTHMNHGSGFYTMLNELMPDYLERKKQLKKIKPTVHFS